MHPSPCSPSLPRKAEGVESSLLPASVFSRNPWRHFCFASDRVPPSPRGARAWPGSQRSLALAAASGASGALGVMGGTAPCCWLCQGTNPTHRQTEQNHLLWRGGSEGSRGESRTEAAWGAMGGNLILTAMGGQESPPQPGDETVKFSDSIERDFSLNKVLKGFKDLTKIALHGD